MAPYIYNGSEGSPSPRRSPSPPIRPSPLPEHISPTKLPLFNISSKTASGSSRRHVLSAPRQRVLQDRELILEHFAALVAALTDSEDVAFIADLPDDIVVAHARVLKAARYPDFKTRPEVQLLCGCFDTSELDFAVVLLQRDLLCDDRLSSDGYFTGQAEAAFTLSIITADGSHEADVRLECSAEHVPRAAAEQLLKLALEHLSPLSPGSSSLTSSVLNFPLQSNDPLPLPWDPELALAPPPLVHSAFLRRATEHPDRPAIDFLRSDPKSGNRFIETVTYRDALSRVINISAALHNFITHADWPAVRNNQRVVPIFMAPCPDLYLTILAILTTAHAFCPLPIDAPQERLKDILDDLGAPVVLGQGPQRFAATGTQSQNYDYSKLNDRRWLDVTAPDAWPVPLDDSDEPTPLNEPSHPTGDDLAYVYYTSGSTGKPKGVQIPHLAATCAISANAAVMPTLGKTEALRYFQLAVPTFDAFILDLFLTMSAGGTLCVAEREIALTDVEGAIDALNANTTHTVPSLAMMLRPERMQSLQNLLCIGEQLNRKVVENFSADAPSMMKHVSEGRAIDGLVNLYGPTEATINVTTETFSSDTRGTIIGDVLPTCFVVLVDDETLEPVAAGLPGHLAIGGPQLSHGYLNRPVENGKAFVSSPRFGRLYLTGDKARMVWTEAGQPKLECMGRIQDGQVKLNGRRVELEEIDSVLASAECVSEAATVTMPAPGGVQLFACVVLDSEYTEAEGEAACRKAAETSLPKWMNPHQYIFYPSLARNVSGKVDRKFLRKTSKEIFEARSSTLSPSRVPPTPKSNPAPLTLDISHPPTDAELPGAICILIKYVLDDHSREVKATTSLFALGLDSLRAIAFLQQARDIGIAELGIQDMLKGLAPKELSRLVIQRRRKAAKMGQHSTSAVVLDSSLHDNPELALMLKKFDARNRDRCVKQLNVPTDVIEAVYPTTYIQTRMVANFLDADTPRDRMKRKPWIEHFVYQLPSDLDYDRFQDAVATSLQRHDIYRTVFTLIEDPIAPCAQVVLKTDCAEAITPWSEIVCTSSRKDLFDRAVENAQRTADEQMCLERPPIAVTFVRSRDGDHACLVLSLFHAIYDGASLKLLREEIMADFNGILAPTRTPLSTAVALHFGADSKATLNFWIAKLAVTPPHVLAGIPFSDGTKASAVPPNPSPPCHSPVSVINRHLEISYTDLVHLSATSLLSTPLSAVQAAWALVLMECQQLTDPSRPTDAPFSYDITFGSTVHGRHSSATATCMAPVLTTIPILLAGDTSDDAAETVGDMARVLATEHAEALTNLQIPCPSLEFARGLTRFDSTLIFQTFGEGSSSSEYQDFPGFENGENWAPGYRGSDFCIPILVEVMPSLSGGGMGVRCTYVNNDERYGFLRDGRGAERLLELFEENLKWVLKRPEGRFDWRCRAGV